MKNQLETKIHMKKLNSDTFFYIFNNIFLLFALLVVAIPLLHVISASFSDARAVSAGNVFLLPVDFSLKGYTEVFKQSKVLVGYGNTIFYTVLGTCINLVFTVMAAYPLSRKNLPFRKIFIMLFTFTMIFSGGMIPTYMLMNNLGLLNSRLVMMLPNAINIFNLTIAKNLLENNVPEELFEAAQIDGCNYFKFIKNIVLPLSKPILAVLALYYAVVHWNAYFDAFLYITDPDKLPLSMALRDILIMNTVTAESMMDAKEMLAKQGMADLLKYSLIVVSSVPLVAAYPFISKHFAKGTLTGAVKG